MFPTLSSKTYVSTSLGMPIMSRHAFLQAFATKRIDLFCHGDFGFYFGKIIV